jgi:CRISPR/Cas system-associated exonuclease Cas4 (RecB family)
MSERYDRVIRASEVGQYAYCAHAWWLGSVRGLPSSRQREMAAGEMIHRRHGRGVRTSLSLNRLAYFVLLMAVLVGIICLLRGMGG